MKRWLTLPRKRPAETLWSPWLAPSVFVTSIATTILFWLVLPGRLEMNVSADYAHFYEPVARSILEGRGITLGDRLAARAPPGYPLLLAALFGLADLLGLREGTVLAGFILVCVGLASVLVFLLARSVWGAAPAFLSAVAWMTYPFTLWLTKQPNSEIPFLVVFYGAFALCWRVLLGRGRPGPYGFASGLLVGVGMLIRPIALGVGVALCLGVWLVGGHLAARRRLLCAGMILLGSVVAVLPWQLWAYSQLGRVILLGTGDASSTSGGLTFGVDLRGYRAPGRVPDDVRELMNDLFRRRDEMQSLSGVVAVVAEESQRRPLATAKLFVIKAIMSWYGTDTGHLDLAILAVQIPYLALLLWCTWRAWQSGGTARGLALAIWILVLYFWAMTATATPLLRYMTPVAGLLFALLPALWMRGPLAPRIRGSLGAAASGPS